MTPVDEIGYSGQQLYPRSLPLGRIWSAFTSEVGSFLTAGPETTTDGSGTTTSPTFTMITTSVTIPVLTTTVDTTIVRTSFVTVHTTTAVPVPHTHTTKCQDPDSCNHTTVTTGPKHTSLSEVATHQTASSTTLSTPSAIGAHHTEQSAAAPSATTSPTASHSHLSHKHAIIGGLSGAIAGLVLIGALIIFFLRRRRRRDVGSEESISEKGLRPILARKWSEITNRRSVISVAPAVSRGSTPDIDGGLIRISTDNWVRPFAHGESYRESMGPGRLRVTNPDHSRPATPLRRSSSSGTGGSFLRQPRSAIAAFLGANRSRGHSASGTPTRDLHVPIIAIDQVESRENLAPARPAPSFRSYTSVSSLPMVEQRPPEDPFLTPPDERDELSTPSTPRRPGAAPLQTAAGAASRTLSHIGSALNPFRSKSNVAMSMRSHTSRQSVSTFFTTSSAGDPFRLEREISVRRPATDYDRNRDRPAIPSLAVYEGT